MCCMSWNAANGIKHFPYKDMNILLLQPPHLRVKKIFVGGLKPEITDQQIRDYFFDKYAPVSITMYIQEAKCGEYLF